MIFKAAIFDMDGLLIDSEPLWQEAEVRVFNPLGVPLTKPECVQTMGLRIDEVVKFWRDKYPWQGPTDEEVATLVVNEVATLVEECGTSLPGVMETVEVCSKLGMSLAIASSSFHRLIEVVVTKLKIKDRFSVIHSAQNEPFGKPHPSVYLSTAKMLKVEARECLVFEDSPAGVTAAKAAGMTCIAVPGEFVNPDKVKHADLVLHSLLEVTPATIQCLGNRIPS